MIMNLKKILKKILKKNKPCFETEGFRVRKVKKSVVNLAGTTLSQAREHSFAVHKLYESTEATIKILEDQKIN